MKNKFYMIDLDGTMYLGTKRIKGAKAFINYLLRNDIGFIFLTNNSCRTQVQAANHMLKMGFEDIRPEMFYTSAMAASDYIASTNPNKRKVNYIGEKGMYEALIENNFVIDSNQPDFVFVGLDRQATYQDYSLALRSLVHGARLVGTNDDRILPSEQGENIGNGSVVKMFEYASSQEAIKIGKPHQVMIEQALKYAQVDKEDVIIIGDNLETDIKMGQDAGIETVLVTTGIHNMEDCYRLNIRPTYIVDNLKGLLK
ncbi:MAG: HAD-IIA family hydrolase [Erysipelotrichaceae bacterium]|nr:HAD-IIA family hydrolase [Erysipelotrichaceae bacterium]